MNDTFPLGNVTRAPLVEIWRARWRPGCGGPSTPVTGPRVRLLRTVRGGPPDLAYARWFRGSSPTRTTRPWPPAARALDPPIPATCAASPCATASGRRRSVRRSRGPAPTFPPCTTAASSEQLVPFLPTSGGSALRRRSLPGVGDPPGDGAARRAGPHDPCHLTTNGAVDAAGRAHPVDAAVDVSVSLDAATAATLSRSGGVEAGRWCRPASTGFCEWGRRRDTYVSVTFCLMTVNWHGTGNVLPAGGRSGHRAR